MRNLSIKASKWIACPPSEAFTLPPQEQLLTLECAHSDSFDYQRLAVRRSEEVFWYLYAWSATGSRVLGVFDTPGQVDFFLALHSDNPLKVPALALQESGPAVRVEAGQLVYPRYEGVYRVGLKSYRVAPDDHKPELLRMEYVDGYNGQLMGVASEKEACLAIYSHFDARLRGCKMC